MKKAIDIILLIFMFLIIYFLQINFFTRFKIFEVMPNLFIIFIMMIGLFLKKDFGIFFGICFGLLLDFFIGTRIGIFSISLGLVGLTSGFLEKSFSKDSKITLILMGAILTSLFELVVYVLNIFFNGITNIELIVFIKILLIEVLYNSILIIIIYPIFTKFGTKLEGDFININFLNFL